MALKSRLAKAAGAETFGQMRDEKLHAVVARSTFRSKQKVKAPHVPGFARSGPGRVRVSGSGPVRAGLCRSPLEELSCMFLCLLDASMWTLEGRVFGVV